MLVRYFGGSVSKEYLFQITNTTKSGVSAYDLIEGSKKIGFSSYGVKGKIEELDVKYTPCIAHVTIKKSFQHFIVIYKIIEFIRHTNLIYFMLQKINNNDESQSQKTLKR